MKHELNQTEQVCLQLPTSAANVTLLAFAAERRAAAAKCRPCSNMLGAQQQIHSSSVRRANDETDGQTDARPLHRPCAAYSASSVKNVLQITAAS